MTSHALRARLDAAGQAHVAAALDHLPPEGRANLLSQLSTVDFDLLSALRRGERRAPGPPDILEPLPYAPAADRDPCGEFARRGSDELARGRVAFALLAGGQASRLRWDGPKGTYPIGPRTDRSLFQILMERLRRAGRDHGTYPPVAITTSAGTDGAIRGFFERHDHFGIAPARVRFSCQGAPPALDDGGRLLFDRPDRVVLTPDGHGGAIASLRTNGVLDEWARRGITTVCTFQVDNPLLRVVDADFVGRLLLGDGPIASKVVLKTDPFEKVGVIVRADGRPAIVEYSEIPERLATARDATGALRYRLGSIAMHAFRLDFLRKELEEALPLHAARREVWCVDAQGVRGRRPAWKFERFLFDLFPRAGAVTVVEVDRDREYAPLKNFDGPDSPATVRAALDAEYRRWYREAGVEPPPDAPLEMSPLVALGPEDLRAP